jgi:hypothetical protein
MHERSIYIVVRCVSGMNSFILCASSHYTYIFSQVTYPTFVFIDHEYIVVRCVSEMTSFMVNKNKCWVRNLTEDVGIVRTSTK